MECAACSLPVSATASWREKQPVSNNLSKYFIPSPPVPIIAQNIPFLQCFVQNQEWPFLKPRVTFLIRNVTCRNRNRNRTCTFSFATFQPLVFYGQDTLQGGCCDTQSLRDGDVTFHDLIHTVTADDQDVGTAQEFMSHIDSILVLLRDGVIV